MPSPHEITGHPAADGVFCGPVHWLDEPLDQAGRMGSPAEELKSFREAVLAAIAGLHSLSLRSQDPAADLLEVQLAWLSDPELVLPVERRILAGEAAAGAWRDEIAGHVREIDPSALADLRDIEQRVLKLLAKTDWPAPPKGVVLAGQDISPSQFLETDWSGGGAILLERGSAASHAAILARGRGIPMIVSAGSIGRLHKSALVDGGSGRCVLDPDPTCSFGKPAPEMTQLGATPPVLAQNLSFELLLNINNLDELNAIDADSCDGIGLIRSEFLFRKTNVIPDEDTQVAVYSAIIKWAKGKQVTFRLFDLGGDKPNFGLAIPLERNGAESRGVRVLLTYQEVLTTQLRAILRASNSRTVRILLPMVSKPEQLAAVRQVLRDCAPALSELPPIGVMVEFPDVAEHPERFADADFFALGTNDLTQFMTGRPRSASGASKLSPGERSELFKLISNVAQYGERVNKAVSLCGDLASDFNSLDDLLKLGLRAFSVPPFKAIEFARLSQST
jgi:phosphoenolpyruvate-protein phosphotransferase (PTS system enzyme I)